VRWSNDGSAHGGINPKRVSSPTSTISIRAIAPLYGSGRARAGPARPGYDDIAAESTIAPEPASKSWRLPPESAPCFQPYLISQQSCSGRSAADATGRSQISVAVHVSVLVAPARLFRAGWELGPGLGLSQDQRRHGVCGAFREPVRGELAVGRENDRGSIAACDIAADLARPVDRPVAGTGVVDECVRRPEPELQIGDDRGDSGGGLVWVSVAPDVAAFWK